MKLYHAYKKQFNVIVFIVSLIGFYFFPPLRWIAGEAISHAQTTTAASIQAQINQKNSDIASLQQEIASYQSELDTLGQQKDSLSTQIKELDITKKSLNANIAVTQNKIDATNLTIQNLSSDINTKQDYINTEIQSISDEIKTTSEYDNTSLLETMLSDNDFTAAWNDINSISAVRESLSKNITDLQTSKGQLENTRTQTVAAKAELTALQSQLSAQQKIVVQNENNENALLKQTKDSESNYQKLLADRVAKVNEFQKDLSDYESQLQFVLDPSKLPSSRVLSWPLQNIFITQLFGKTVDSKRLYVSGSHDGVDFRAAIGTPVMAMADGIVLGTGNTDLTCPGASYGNFVFIQYNNGLSSTFGHLSLITSKVGQVVTRGEVVGYSGATGYVTGPHLHVSLYASEAVKRDTIPSKACTGQVSTQPIAPVNAYLNVLDYLPPLTLNSTTYKGGDSIGE